ncbi:MAG: hypothetical protein U5O39_01130 [Gammaproteobacteria bacterium]|nr:hypothetical protein [Gammaproteobacteria bacterium]
MYFVEERSEFLLCRFVDHRAARQLDVGANRAMAHTDDTLDANLKSTHIDLCFQPVGQFPATPEGAGRLTPRTGDG